MKIFSYTILTILLFSNCTKEEISTEDVLSMTQCPSTVTADGQTEHKIIVELNKETDNDKRTLSFNTDAGFFKDGDKRKQSIEAEAKLINDSALAATVTLVSPYEMSSFNISVQPTSQSQNDKYEINKEIQTIEIKPAKLQLEASSFSVYNNYQGEITITGKLSSENNTHVTNGATVTFVDLFANTGQDIEGRFRANELVSKNSMVTAIYSPGAISPNQDIMIIGIVEDQFGMLTDIKDTLIIHVNQP